MWGAFVKLGEAQSTPMAGPVNFATKEERDTYCKGEESVVYWYHYSEEDDWHLWRRGGAWKRTAKPAAADNVPEPPEITPQDRRW